MEIKRRNGTTDIVQGSMAELLERAKTVLADEEVESVAIHKPPAPGEIINAGDRRYRVMANGEWRRI